MPDRLISTKRFKIITELKKIYETNPWIDNERERKHVLVRVCVCVRERERERGRKREREKITDYLPRKILKNDCHNFIPIYS